MVEPTVMVPKAKYRVRRNSSRHGLTDKSDGGGVGRNGRRKAMGWHKGWAKTYRDIMGIEGNNLPRVLCFGTRKEKKA